MNELQIRRWMRGECGKMGWTLLIYNMIMSTAVTAVCMADALIRTVMLALEGTAEDLAEIYANTLSESMTSNAWGYIFAMLLGWGILLLWKKRQFCLREIWQTGKTMTCSAFFRILFVFLSGQAVFQVLAIVLESIFSLFGMSVMGPIESASAMGDSLSMFLYIGLFAPIGEEILFRGLILRSLQPFGKKFTILASAILFGLFHGNIVQSPYAFAVGLVLGYTAVEYSIGWAMVLHMINNLILGDMFTRLAELLPEPAGNLIMTAVIWGAAIAGIVILITNRKGIRAFRDEGKIHPWPVQSFFSSAGILVLSGYMILNMVLMLFMQ